jgi:hypothetical protein
MSRGTSIAVLVGLAVAIPTGGRAAEIIWAGNNVSSTWNNGPSWVLGTAPVSTDSVSLKGWEPLVRTGWTVTASATNTGNPASNTKDGRNTTYWWSGTAGVTNMNVVINLGSTQTFGGLDMVETANGTDFPASYGVYGSPDNSTWTLIYTQSVGSANDSIQFGDQTYQYIKIQLSSNSPSSHWWAISELTVWGTAGDTQLDMTGMTATSSTSYSSGGQGPAANAVDFDVTTLFQTGANQTTGQWFNLNLGATQTISAITMDSYGSTGDYANSYLTEYSTTSTCNGTLGTYNTLVNTTTGSSEFIQVTFAATAVRCVRVTLKANSGSNWWTLAEFHVFGTPATATLPGATTLAGLNIKTAATFAQGSGNTLTVNGNFNQSAGTFTGNNSAVKVTGNFNLSGGTFTSTSDLLSVIGSFNKTGGTYTHNSGRLMLSATSNQTFATNGATFNNVIINDGLVGYWKLDDGTTPIVDSSGYAQSGTLSNTPSWVGAGVLPTLNFTDGNAMTLNGTSQQARITRTSALEPAAVTVSAWIKRSGSQTSYTKLVSKTYNNGANSPYGSYELQLNPGGSDTTLVGFEAGTTVNSYGAVSGTGAVLDATWTHVAGVYDPSVSPQMRIYVNGVSAGTATTSGTLLYDTSSTGDLYFGQNGSAAAAQYFKGSIDDVRIYGRALTAAEINSLYIGNQPGTTKATQTMTGSPVTVLGDLVLASGKLDIGGNSLNVGGNWYNYGGLFTSTGTVALTNGCCTYAIRSAGQQFFDLQLNGTNGIWKLEDWLKVSDQLSFLQNGTLQPGAYAIHAGNISKTSGTLTAGTGTVVIDTSANAVSESSGFSFNNLRIETTDETSLAGYWKFDEGQGTVLHDASGAGNDGTLFGSTNWVGAAANLPSAIDFDNHAALSFNGTTAYGTLPLAGEPATTAAKTVAMWVNLSSTAGTQDFFSVLNNTPGTNYVIGVRSGTIAALKASGVVMASVAAPATGSWHHVAYTYDGVSTSTVYLDGTTVGSGATAPTGTNATIWIGSREGTTEMYSGQLDDLRVYSVALTAAQVKGLAAGGYAGLGSNDTVSLGANLTVNGTLTIDNGTLDTSSYTVNAAGAASVNAGTLKVGSNTATFNGGLTVGTLGSVTENTAGGKVALATGKALEFDEPSGGVVGFPTAAFNWNNFSFWREYVTYTSYVGATTADTVLAMTADGGTKYSWQLPSAHGSLLGTPRWNTEGTSPGTQYIYLITTTGYVYKVLDDGTQLATVSGWPYRNVTGGANATATSPLANDSSNLYWSGFAGDGVTADIFSLNMTGPTLNSALSITSTVSAAPALATVGGTNYVFFAIAAKVYQEPLNLGTGFLGTQPTTTVSGRVTVYNNIVYIPDNNGNVFALTATNSAGPTTSWSYQDRTSTGHTGAGCTSGSHVCPAVSNLYVDVTANRTCFGDADGHIYVLNSSGTALAGFPYQGAAGDVITVAPVSRNGVLLVGATNGANYKVYDIDENNAGTRGAVVTYTFSAAVSSISFNPSANAGSGAYTVGTTDGKLYYINAATDPSSGTI